MSDMDSTSNADVMLVSLSTLIAEGSNNKKPYVSNRQSYKSHKTLVCKGTLMFVFVENHIMVR